MSETIRYDVLEDRANDIKRHDNKHHLSHWKNNVRLLEAGLQESEGVRGKFVYYRHNEGFDSPPPPLNLTRT